MKKVFLFTLLLMFTASLYAQEAKITYHDDAEKKEENKNGPVARFDTIVYNFGDLEQRVPQTAEFHLSNDGNEPLLISYAKASCGCTNLKYSKEPIMPGNFIPISVTYNAAAPGKFIKTITIRTNAENAPQTILQIRGTVIKKDPPSPPPKKKEEVEKK